MAFGTAFGADSEVARLNSDYKVFLNGRDVTQYALASVSLDDTTKRIYSTLDVSFISIPRFPLNVNVGMKIEFYFRELKLFSGIIFMANYSDEYVIDTTAYDEGVYYSKNYVNKQFNNATAASIIRTVVNDAGLPLGTVDDTGYVIPELSSEDKDIASIIYETLETTEAQTGVTYYPVLRNGKLNVIKRLKPATAITISEGHNIIDVSQDISIDSLANDIIVRGGNQDNPTTARASDSDSIKKYGRMQMIDKVDEKAAPSHAKDRANKLLAENKDPAKDVSLTAIGDWYLRSGDSIYLEAPRVNAVGEYVVEEISHNIDMTTHTMSLTITKYKGG